MAGEKKEELGDVLSGAESLLCRMHWRRQAPPS